MKYIIILGQIVEWITIYTISAQTMSELHFAFGCRSSAHNYLKMSGIQIKSKATFDIEYLYAQGYNVVDRLN